MPKELRRVEDLTSEERKKLEATHRRLRKAARAFEPYLSHTPLKPGELPVYSRPEVIKAQEDLLEADEELWRLRALLLGWIRPASTPDATEVTEWILEDEEG